MICVTGTASGIGAATKSALEALGHKVIGVDLRNADVCGDLSKAGDRERIIAEVMALCGGVLDGVVPCAGVSNPASNELKVRINFYGTLAVVNGLRPALEKGNNPAVVMISSNSTTMTPGLTLEDAMIFLNEDEETAVARFNQRDEYIAYPAGKLAIAFWVRMQSNDWSQCRRPWRDRYSNDKTITGCSVDERAVGHDSDSAWPLGATRGDCVSDCLFVIDASIVCGWSSVVC